jgi:hypothetical protein
MQLLPVPAAAAAAAAAVVPEDVRDELMLGTRVGACGKRLLVSAADSRNRHNRASGWAALDTQMSLYYC